MNLKGDSSERRSCLARQYFHEHNFVNFDLLPPMVLQLFQKGARNAKHFASIKKAGSHFWLPALVIDLILYRELALEFFQFPFVADGLFPGHLF